MAENIINKSVPIQENEADRVTFLRLINKRENPLLENYLDHKLVDEISEMSELTLAEELEYNPEPKKVIGTSKLWK